MNEQTDLVHFILGSKAETLRRVQPKLEKSKVADQITHTWYFWKHKQDQAIKKIQSKFAGQYIIVRSSSVKEDNWETSNAGAFESVLSVDCDDEEAVRELLKVSFHLIKIDLRTHRFLSNLLLKT